jgi:cytochrome P450
MTRPLSRSMVHMLTTFAVRLEIDHGPAEAVKAIRLFARDRAIRRAEHRDWTAEDQKRTERQRTLFAMLPSSDATDRLKDAMLQRAYDLMWDGDPIGADAILDFLPSAAVDVMLAAWSKDFDDDGPKSQWHSQ